MIGIRRPDSTSKSSQTRPSTGGARRIGRPAAVMAAAAVLLAACDDGRVFKEPARRGQAAKLVVPTTMTPPVRVLPVDGAPAAWKLHTLVAESLRQRDVPAGTTVRGRNLYTLSGKVVQIHRRGAKTQVTIKWRLNDPNGRKVGEVTQMAAVPAAVASAATGKGSDGDDVTEAMAEAAAESISPIVPSSRLRTSQQAMTGLPTPKTRRKVEQANPVTAIGKTKKRQTRLGRHLLNPRKPAKDAPGAAAATDPAKAKTALGRRGAGKSALSRNLLKRKPLSVPARSADGKDTLPPPKRQTAARTSGATSGQGRRADDRRSRPAAAAPGSMEDLVRRYPTRTEQEDSGTARAAAPTGTPRGRRVAPAPRLTADADPARKMRRPVARDGRPAVTRVATASRADRRRAARRATAMRRAAARPAPRRAARRDAARPVADKAASRKPIRRAPTRLTPMPGRRVYWVQIGSYRSKALAELKWNAARRAAGRTLAQANRRIMRASIEQRGVFYRVQIGPYVRRDNAFGMCRRLKSRELDCFLYRETEQAVLPVTEAGGPASRPPVRLKRPPAATRPAPRAKRQRRVITRLSPATGRDPRSDKAPVSTSPGLPGLPK